MKFKKNGEAICYSVYRFMPELYKQIFPVIHSLMWKGIHLRENQIKVIMAVNYTKKTTSTELSKGLNIPKGSLTTIIGSLVDKKIIKKTPDKEDERVVYLTLTGEGKELLEFKRKHDEEKLNELFALLPGKEISKIVKGFDVFVNCLERLG